MGRNAIGRRAALHARRSPAAELDALRERIARLEAENALLRARLERLHPRRRPRYRPWERLAILWHRGRYGLSISATARAFVVSVQTIVDRRAEVAKGSTTTASARAARASEGRASSASIRRWAPTALKRAELAGRAGVTFPSLRHGFATHYLGHGGTVPDLMGLLGHRNLSTTMIYAHLVDARTKAGVEALAFGAAR